MIFAPFQPFHPLNPHGYAHWGQWTPSAPDAHLSKWTPSAPDYDFQNPVHACLAGKHPHWSHAAIKDAVGGAQAIYASVMARLRHGNPSSIHLGGSWVPAGLVNYDFIAHTVIQTTVATINVSGVSGHSSFIRGSGVGIARDVITRLTITNPKRSLKQIAAYNHELTTALDVIASDIVTRSADSIRIQTPGGVAMVLVDLVALLVYYYLNGSIAVEYTDTADTPTKSDNPVAVNEPAPEMMQFDTCTFETERSKTATSETVGRSDHDIQHDIHVDELYHGLRARWEQLEINIQSLVMDVRDLGLFMPVVLELTDYEAERVQYEQLRTRCAGSTDSIASLDIRRIETATRLYNLVTSIREQMAAAHARQGVFDVELAIINEIEPPKSPQHGRE